MLDRMVKKAREKQVFSREDTPTERRVSRHFCIMLAYRTGDQAVRLPAVRGYQTVVSPVEETV